MFSRINHLHTRFSYVVFPRNSPLITAMACSIVINIKEELVHIYTYIGIGWYDFIPLIELATTNPISLFSVRYSTLHTGVTVFPLGQSSEQ